MTMIRSDGRQEVVDAGVAPGQSSSYDRNWGGALNRVIATCTGTSQYQITAGPCVFAGVEMSSGAATVVTAYDATSASSNPFWSRSLSTATGDGPANGPVLVQTGLFLTFSTTSYTARVLGIPST